MPRPAAPVGRHARRLRRAPRMGARRCSTRATRWCRGPRRTAAATRRLWEWLIFEEEYYRAGAPQRVTQNGIFLLAPTIFEFGTDEQKDRILPKMAAGRADVVPGLVGAERGQRPRRHRVEGRARRRGRRLARSPARRRGRRAARSARTSSACSAAIPTPNGTAASRTSSSTSRRRASPCAASNASTATKASPRCSSTTCSCPTPTCSASRNHGWEVAMATTGSERGLTLRSPGPLPRDRATADRPVPRSAATTRSCATVSSPRTSTPRRTAGRRSGP